MGGQCVWGPRTATTTASREREATPQVTKTIILAERWRHYGQTGDRKARDQLIVAYSPKVKYVAGRIASRMPAHVDVADLVSYGLGGLINAVERFEPARGIKFESYADKRIRGAIFDELRTLDWVPRAVRTEARAIETATTELSTRLQRMPSDAELGAELSMDPAQLSASLQRVADARLVALDQPWRSPTNDEIEPTVLATLPDPTAVDPAASADERDRRERIGQAIGQLPERERVVVGLRYYQDLRFSEIGDVLGVSESRANQLHAKAVIQMRTLLPDEGSSPPVTRPVAAVRAD
ncbi:MAG TPA: FliA/WhiG family RNA polymerase sigma factor [Conexibacter sp.]|nr:FliA/WhiG family RNA polymerase sigma factor [Conexibacter sp.]